MNVTLPGGYADVQGVVHREATLVPLCGGDEEWLAQQVAADSPALLSALLSRCVQRLGAISPITEEVARGMLIADRQYLLLKLRETTFGEHVQASLVCPMPDCGKRVTMNFSTRDVPISASPQPGPTHRVRLSPQAAWVDERGRAHRDVVFRLPNGSDQEALSVAVAEDETQAQTLLLARCVQQVGDVALSQLGAMPEAESVVGQFSALARMEIEQAMAATTPQLELSMGVRCHECGREFELPFDIQRFMLGELKVNLDALYREVHYLAYYYHWSEREVMEMSQEKRRRYIQILTNELEGMSHALG